MTARTRCEGLDLVELAHRERLPPRLYCHMTVAGRLDLPRLRRAAADSCRYVPELLAGVDVRRGCFVERGLHAADMLEETGPDGPPDPRWDLEAGPQLKLFCGQQAGQTRLTVGASHILTDGGGLLQYMALLCALYSGTPPAVGHARRGLPPGLVFPRRAARGKGEPRRDAGVSAQENKAVAAAWAGDAARPAGGAARGSAPGALPALTVSAGPPSAAAPDAAPVPPPLPLPGGPPAPFCVRCVLPAQTLAALRRWAGEQGATVNDLLLAAYARVLARRQGSPRVSLSCPADLRRLAPPQSPQQALPDGGRPPPQDVERAEVPPAARPAKQTVPSPATPSPLTVANMTGLYRDITAVVAEGDSFAVTLRQIRQQTARQKAARACLEGLPALELAHRLLPNALLTPLLRRLYRPAAVSYTNFGVIDEAKLRWAGCTVTDCFLTGTYRRPPDFQLTASTFRGVCTLSAAGLGSAGDAQAGQVLLEQVKAELCAALE